jgi:uncharacterized protein YciU (UPF0263 family)
LKVKQQAQQNEDKISSAKEVLQNADVHHLTLNHTNNADAEKQRLKDANWKNVEYDVDLPTFALVFTVANNSNNNNNDTYSILKNATYNRLDSIFKNHFQDQTQKFDHLLLNFSIITTSATRRQLQQQLTQRRQEQTDADQTVAKVDGKAYYTGGSAPKAVDNGIIEEAFADADTPMKVSSDGLITRTVLVLNPKFDSRGQLVHKSRRWWIWLLVIGILLLKFILVAFCVHICKERQHARRLRAEMQKRYSSNNALDDDEFSWENSRHCHLLAQNARESYRYVWWRPRSKITTS